MQSFQSTCQYDAQYAFLPVRRSMDRVAVRSRVSMRRGVSPTESN